MLRYNGACIAILKHVLDMTRCFSTGNFTKTIVGRRRVSRTTSRILPTRYQVNRLGICCPQPIIANLWSCNPGPRWLLAELPRSASPPNRQCHFGVPNLFRADTLVWLERAGYRNGWSGLEAGPDAIWWSGDLLQLGRRPEIPFGFRPM